MDVLFEACRVTGLDCALNPCQPSCPSAGVCLSFSTRSGGAGSCRHAFPIKSWARNRAHLAQSQLPPAYRTRPWSSDLESSRSTHPVFLSFSFSSLQVGRRTPPGCSTVPTSPCWPVCRGGRTLHPSTRCVPARPWSPRKPSDGNVSLTKRPGSGGGQEFSSPLSGGMREACVCRLYLIYQSR